MDKSQLKIFDDLQKPPDLDSDWRAASVLILIYPRAGEDYVVFMRRTETVEHHKGQISLPGGGRDATDPDEVFTALREAKEELGIEPSHVEVLCTLLAMYAKISNFAITPVVGRLKLDAVPALTFVPEPAEVAEVIEVPLRFFFEEAGHHTEVRTREGVTYELHFYNYGPYEIWGVTGRIMYEFTRHYTLADLAR